MNFWETITGSDLTREWKAFEARSEALPADYRAAWEKIKVHLSPYSDFTGRNLMPILDGALGLLEETASEGQSIHEVLHSSTRAAPMWIGGPSLTTSALGSRVLGRGRRGTSYDTARHEPPGRTP